MTFFLQDNPAVTEDIRCVVVGDKGIGKEMLLDAFATKLASQKGTEKEKAVSYNFTFYLHFYTSKLKGHTVYFSSSLYIINHLHLTNSESCTVWLPIEFHGFTIRIYSKGYHSLVPGLISIF